MQGLMDFITMNTKDLIELNEREKPVLTEEMFWGLVIQMREAHEERVRKEAEFGYKVRDMGKE